MNEDEKKAWQEQQAAIDAAQEKQREKDEKARARKARKAKRKVERLKRELSKSGDLTDWEDEFTGSISERLEKFDSAFADPEKGRRADALSYAQKAIISQLSKKAKKSKASGQDGEQAAQEFKPRSSFKSKARKFTPRVRQLDEDYEDEDASRLGQNLGPQRDRAEKTDTPNAKAPPPVKGKPFLRLVKNDDG